MHFIELGVAKVRYGASNAGGNRNLHAKLALFGLCRALGRCFTLWGVNPVVEKSEKLTNTMGHFCTLYDDMMLRENAKGFTSPSKEIENKLRMLLSRLCLEHPDDPGKYYFLGDNYAKSQQTINTLVMSDQTRCLPGGVWFFLLAQYYSNQVHEHIDIEEEMTMLRGIPTAPAGKDRATRYKEISFKNEDNWKIQDFEPSEQWCHNPNTFAGLAFRKNFRKTLSPELAEKWGKKIDSLLKKVDGTFDIPEGTDYGPGRHDDGRVISEPSKATKKERQEKLFSEMADTLGALCLLYTSPSPRDRTRSRMPSSA